MDIKERIEELIEKLKKDDDLMEKFQKDPVGAIEGLVGIDLPNDQIEKVVDGIKAKLSVDKLSDALGGLGGLFGKK